jgi:hypothetical protein
MYNFNYEYMTFLYVVHVYVFCNVELYYIALPARLLFAIKIIIIISNIQCRTGTDPQLPGKKSSVGRFQRKSYLMFYKK